MMMTSGCDNNLQFACNLCQQVFDTVQQLVSHKRTIHFDQLYEVTYPLGSSPSSSGATVLSQCYLNGEIVTHSSHNVPHRIPNNAPPPPQPDPPISVQMTNNISVIVAPRSATVNNTEIDLNSVGTDLPLFKENEMDLSDSAGSSCKYCGELFSKCERDEVDEVSCKSCANLFGNSSISNSNQFFNSSTTIVLNSHGDFGLNNFASSSTAGSSALRNILSKSSNSFVVAPKNVGPNILSRRGSGSAVAATDVGLNYYASVRSVAAAKNFGNGPVVSSATSKNFGNGPVVSSATSKNLGNGYHFSSTPVTGNQNGLGHGSSTPLVKKYGCKFCEKKFAGSTERKTHERVHTGERPYSCGVCPKAFTQTGSRSKHEKNVHGFLRRAHVPKAQQVTALFGKSNQVSKNLNSAAAEKSMKLPHFLNAVVSGKQSMEIPQNLDTDQDDEYSDDVPIIVSVSTLAVPKPISIKQEVIQIEEESDNYFDPDISTTLSVADSSLNMTPENPMPPPRQYPPSKSRRPAKKSSPVAFKCKYCRAKFKEEAHAKGHSRMCSARFTLEKPSPLNFQFPTFPFANNVKTNPHSPPLTSPPAPSTSKNTQKSDANNINNSTPKRRPRDEVEEDEDQAPKLIPAEPVLSPPRRRASTTSNATTNMSPPVLTPELGPATVKIEPGTQRLNPKKRIPCKYCKNTYELRYIFIHERLHTGERPFECKFCSKGCISEKGLERHMKNNCKMGRKGKNNFTAAYDLRKVKIEPNLPVPGDEKMSEENNQAGCSPQNANNKRSPINNQRPHSSGQPPLAHHTCRFCSYSSKYLQHVQMHENTHTGEKPFKCRNCSFRAGNPGRLFEHRQANPNCRSPTSNTHKTVPEKPSRSPTSPKFPAKDPTTGRLRCSRCPKTFKDKVSLKIHRYKHTGQKPFACEYCDFRTDNPGKLYYHRTHRCKGVPALGSFKCPKCPREFQDYRRLKLHDHYHRTPLPYGCRQCDFRFKDLNALKIHKTTCVGLSKTKEQLPKEAKGTGSTNTSPKAGPSLDKAAEICGKNGPNSSGGQVRRGRKRKVRPEVDIHINEDSDHPSGRRFSCNICSARFIHRSHAAGHILNVHRKLAHRCDKCDRRFSELSELVSHATEQHAEDKPYVCPKCPLRFDNRNLLRIHLAGHDGDEPLLCLECGEWFRYDISFKQHFKTYHTSKGQLVL